MNRPSTIPARAWTELHEQGFAVITRCSRSRMEETAALLGQPVPARRGDPVVSILRPTVEANAHPRSLSRRFGLGSFPFHTDGAHFPVPPRWILLRSPELSEIPTLVSPIHRLIAGLDDHERRILRRETWITAGAAGRFYCSPLSTDNSDGPLIRFDPGCMKPVEPFDGHAGFTLERICSEPDAHESVGWERGKLALIDNWRCLHARPPVQKDDTHRTLERIMVLA